MDKDAIYSLVLHLERGMETRLLLPFVRAHAGATEPVHYAEIDSHDRTGGRSIYGSDVQW